MTGSTSGSPTVTGHTPARWSYRHKTWARSFGSSVMDWTQLPLSGELEREGRGLSGESNDLAGEWALLSYCCSCRVNGMIVGHASNYHRRYKFNVTVSSVCSVSGIGHTVRCSSSYRMWLKSDQMLSEWSSK